MNQENTERENRCEYCGVPFETRQAMLSHVRNKHPEVDVGTEKQSTALTKHKPVEALIKEARLPDIVNGSAKIFDAGVEYGMNCILIGVRVAQELSRMGIDQATPIIKMAQEMRQTEGQVAKETGLAMGETLAGKIFEFMDQRLPVRTEAPIQNPMMDMFLRVFQSTMGRLFGGAAGNQPTTPGFVDKRVQK